MNINKITSALLLSFSLSFSSTVFSENETKDMIAKSKKSINNLKPFFNNMEKINNDFRKNKLNDFEKFTKNKRDYDQELNLFSQTFNGSEFLSKEEGVILSKYLRSSLSESKKDKEFLLYFFSESVPKTSTLNILLSIDILKQNGINIESKQYMIGPPKDYKAYMNNWKDTIERYPSKYRVSATNSFAMKLDIDFFKELKIKRVPVLALAECKTLIPDMKNCKIEYLMSGDSPLVTFFENISREDKSYKKYVQILNANGIFINKKVDNNETN